MDQKRREWQQNGNTQPTENWPFGRPGPGAGPNKQQQQRIDEMNQNNNNSNYNNNNNQDSQKSAAKNRRYMDKLNEYKELNAQLEAIAEAERKLKQDTQPEQMNYGETRRPLASSMSFNKPSPPVPIIPQVYHDQTKLPAAMRTSLAFGDVSYEDDIRKTKEAERKKWLAELEEQKRERNAELSRQANLTNLYNLASARGAPQVVGGGFAMNNNGFNAHVANNNISSILKV
jgi:hypothetical protein